MDVDSDRADPAVAVQEIRHPMLYFADGDIVISATDATDESKHYFRVDKVLLARNSPVFKDMLQLGNDSACNEQYDGAPLVHFTDDAKALSGLLGALYNMSSLPLIRLHPDNAVNVWGIMELANKYDVDSICKAIRDFIESDWPKSFAEWERRQQGIQQLLVSEGREDDHMKNWAKCPEPASAVRFALEFNCHSILPAAFYELGSSWTAAEWDSGQMQKSIIRPARWKMLHTDDLLRIIRAKGCLEERRSTMENMILNRVGDKCQCMANECGQTVQRLFDDNRDFTSFDPLGFLLHLATIAESNLDYHLSCDTGAEAWSLSVKTAALDTWKLIPGYFDIVDLTDQEQDKQT